ncbi:MAG: integrin alpha [Candidatus Sumerlaeota bacterium]|nr:integrin alpha [Candidatus Sumerlaeota bacterium]
MASCNSSMRNGGNRWVQFFLDLAALAVLLGAFFATQIALAEVSVPTPPPNWLGLGTESQISGYGFWVSSAGDVNGDGYKDIIVGGQTYDTASSDVGKVYVYYGSASGLPATPSWTLEGDHARMLLGTCVACAGDVNGDGYDDIIVGGAGWQDPYREDGIVLVYYGSATGLKSSPTPSNADWSYKIPGSLSNLGYSVACAGDVNGDGYKDIIIGAFTASNGQTQEGRAYLFHGSASGLSATPNWTGESNLAYANYGYFVSLAGDVNGDGYSDVIIGAPNYSSGGFTKNGRAYVYYGSASGLSATPNWTADGVKSNENFGYSVASVGDMNHDDYGDIIIGGPNFSNVLSGVGKAYIYYGSASGLPAAAGWTYVGDQASASFGCCVASAGDFDGDGFGDVIIGEFWRSNGQTKEGRAYIFCGSASGMATTATWIAEGNSMSADSRYGFCVAGAGDLNKDGAGDVIVGSNGYQSVAGGPVTGGAFVYYGTAPAKPSESLEIVSVTQTPEKNVDIVYNLTSADPAPANGYDISTLAMATAQDCAATSGTPDSAFDDITPYVTGSTHIASGSGLLTWNIKGMPAGALKSKYWKAGVSVLFRLKATPKE